MDSLKDHHFFQGIDWDNISQRKPPKSAKIMPTSPQKAELMKFLPGYIPEYELVIKNEEGYKTPNPKSNDCFADEVKKS